MPNQLTIGNCVKDVISIDTLNPFSNSSPKGSDEQPNNTSPDPSQPFAHNKRKKRSSRRLSFNSSMPGAYNEFLNTVDTFLISATSSTSGTPGFVVTGFNFETHDFEASDEKKNTPCIAIPA